MIELVTAGEATGDVKNPMQRESLLNNTMDLILTDWLSFNVQLTHNSSSTNVNEGNIDPYDESMGCISHYINAEDQNSTARVVFVQDYIKLWNRYALCVDENDEFGRIALLFEVIIQFLLDRRVMIAIGYFTAYISSLWLIALFLQPSKAGPIMEKIVVELFYYIFYVGIASVYKSSFSASLFSAVPLASTKPQIAYSDRAIREYRHFRRATASAPWYSVMWICFGAIGSELKMLMGISRDDVLPVHHINDNSGGGDIYLQHQKSGGCCHCAFFLLLLVGAKFLNGNTTTKQNVDNYARYGILFCSMVITLFALYSAVINAASYDCIFTNTTVKFHMTGYNCNVQFLIFFSGGPLVSLFAGIIEWLSMLIGVIGLRFGATQFHLMAQSWIGRFASLRRLTTANSSPNATDDGNSIDAKANSRALAMIERDAFEHYLFLQQYARQSSRLWSPVIFIILLVSFCGLVSCVVGLITTMSTVNAFFLAFTFVLVLFVFVYPIYNIAYANDAVACLLQYFLDGAAPTDYQVLGGRDRWIEHVKQSPAYWTLFGFPITWSWLYTCVGGLFSSVFFYLIATQGSNLPGI